MSEQHVRTTPLSRRQESRLKELRGVIQKQGLLAVLASLPGPDSSTFSRTQESGHSAIKLFLGHRSKVDGSTCQAWTCIISGKKNPRPPVFFYDQEISGDGSRVFQYPRSSSSLLRKATDLHPPFCFLQHDPHDDSAIDMRNMLCAIILYKALVSGIDDYALHWTMFEESLGRALRYIDSRAAYHQWLHGRKIASLKPAVGGGPSTLSPRENSDEVSTPTQSKSRTAEHLRTASSVSDVKYVGGTVRPGDGDTAIKPNTSLWRLKNQIGDTRFRLLDSIPLTPMRFSPHTLGEPYFPFRLQVGTHDRGSGGLSGVYAYLIHDGVKMTVVKILSHDSDGGEAAWAMQRLESVDLLEPFNYLNNLTTKSNGAKPGDKARAAKIRSIISYYFFLAENEGLIGDPRITVGESFGKRLCTACVELQEANFSIDDNGDDENKADNCEETNIENSSPEPRGSVNEFGEREAELTREGEVEDEPSVITTFRLQPCVLEDIIRTGPLKYRGEVPHHDAEPEKSQTELQDLALEEPPHGNPPIRQLELRPSSQVTHEAPHSPSANSNHEADGSVTPFDNFGALRSDAADDTHTRRSYATGSLGVLHVQDEPVIEARIDDTRSLNDGLAALPLESKQVAVGEGPSAIEKTNVVAAVVHHIETIVPEYLTSGLIRQPRSDVSNESGDRSVSMDISPSSSPARSRSHTPAVQLNRCRASSESDESAVSNTCAVSQSIQMKEYKLVTPERITERDEGSQPAPSVVGHPKSSPNISQFIELSDDESYEDAAVSPMRNEVERTPEASHWVEDGSKTARLSSSVRSRKRKSVLISDSDGNLAIIEEQRQSEEKRKVSLSDKEKTKRLKARHAAERPPNIHRRAAISETITPLRLDQRLNVQNREGEGDTVLIMGQLSKKKDNTGQTQKARARPREGIDLTQASSSPQGQNQTPVLVVHDTDDDVIEEVDNGAWRRATQSRR